MCISIGHLLFKHNVMFEQHTYLLTTCTRFDALLDLSYKRLTATHSAKLLKVTHQKFLQSCTLFPMSVTIVATVPHDVYCRRSYSTYQFSQTPVIRDTLTRCRPAQAITRATYIDSGATDT